MALPLTVAQLANVDSTGLMEFFGAMAVGLGNTESCSLLEA